ncbi:MAG: hypothetical protein JSR59_16775 [Proteobacteria bacterium]|nr:hypothetical protein [Pseudomonadota bacterium]
MSNHTPADPWSTLVAALSGARRHTPSRWPSARVHRVLDDPPPPAQQSARPLLVPVPGRNGSGA